MSKKYITVVDKYINIDPACAARVQTEFMACITKAYKDCADSIDKENTLNIDNLKKINDAWRTCRKNNKCDDLIHDAAPCKVCDDTNYRDTVNENTRHWNRIGAIEYLRDSTVQNDYGNYDPRFPFGQESDSGGDRCTCCTKANNAWKGCIKNSAPKPPRPVPYPDISSQF